MTAPASCHTRFVLTGPTGWIGSALLALMNRTGDPDALTASETVSLFGSNRGTIALGDGRHLPVRALSDITPDDVAGSHVIHLAYLTKDKVTALGEAEFLRTNKAIDDALFAALSVAAPASLFVASSGAARLAKSGYDKHPYGLAKLSQEARFLDWARQKTVPTLCGRIFNLAGPHINKLDAYAVSNFAVQALNDKRIAITAAQPVFRSFLHVEDLSRIILRAARQGIGGERPIDLCGAELLEMQDIAQLVAQEIGGPIPLDRPAIDFDARSDYLGSAQDTWIIAKKLAIELTGIRKQVGDTVDWIRHLEALSVPRAMTQGNKF